MATRQKIQEDKYSHKFSIKNALPYLHGVFLLTVWLFSRSDAILAISFIPDLPLLKREQGRTLLISTARRTKPKISGQNIPTAKIQPQNLTAKV